MDNASYNTSMLTTEFIRRLGVAPRFSTPWHPEGNSLVERYNAVIKKMIHHAIHSGVKEWDKLLPFMLWATRETPNATTGISPFELVYGRPARGPLAILRETWAGEQKIPTTLGEPAIKYMQRLKEDLEIAKDLAAENARKNQRRYTENYNLRSKEKTFDEGEKVIVLMADSGNKLYSRWIGPVKIRRKISENSYDVEMEDGSVRRLHANHLRKFHERIRAIGVIYENNDDSDDLEYAPIVESGELVNSVGVVYENDREFGDLECIPVKLDNHDEPIEEKFKLLKLDHLSIEERNDVLKIIQKHKDVFSDKPGCCDKSIAEHVIKLKVQPENWPKQPKPYRVPPIFKDEVDRQINELLREGMIQRSTSPVTHPLVCVLKSDNSVRLCTDNRYINSLSEVDGFPMKRIDEILDCVGAAKYITCLDCTSGYWNIPLHVNSRPLTGFVANSESFEWLRMNFGLRNSAATYQRAMEKILRPHAKHATAYIDDISVYSNSWNEHLHHLDGVLQTIEESGFKLRLSKCKFAQQQIKLLGQIVGNGERRVDPKKVEAVQEIKIPKTKKELQSFIGIINFYREFLPELSRRALCLTELTKGKSRNVTLNDEQIRTFQELKSALTTTPVLSTPVFDGKTPFILQCDASNFAVATTTTGWE
jgi:hypothetical protein